MNKKKKKKANKPNQNKPKCKSKGNPNTQPRNYGNLNPNKMAVFCPTLDNLISLYLT